MTEINKWITRLPIAPSFSERIYMVNEDDIKSLTTLISKSRKEAVEEFINWAKGEVLYAGSNEATYIDSDSLDELHEKYLSQQEVNNE
jgi:hypothetical protein